MQKPAFSSRAIGEYLVLSFGIAWLLWLPIILGADGLHLFAYSLPEHWIAIGTAGPIAAAFIAAKRSTGRWLPSRFFPPAHAGRILALLVAPALILIPDVIPYIVATQPGTRHPAWSCFSPLLVWINVLGGPLGEEFGWRGFLLPRLTARLGPTPATLILALIWTAWHLPLFLVHIWGHPPLWFFLSLLTIASVFMTFGYNLTGGSILSAILAHFTLNAAPVIYGNLLATAQSRSTPDWLLLVSPGIIAIALIVLTRGRLGLAKSEEPNAPPQTNQ
jgi:uncharacterized protein